MKLLVYSGLLIGIAMLGITVIMEYRQKSHTDEIRVLNYVRTTGNGRKEEGE